MPKSAVGYQAFADVRRRADVTGFEIFPRPVRGGVGYAGRTHFPPADRMKRRPLPSLRTAGLALAVLAGAAPAQAAYTLADVQGVWWSDCTQPAAEFGLDGDSFYGDFEGRFRARVERGVLRVDPLDAKAPPRAWRILAADRARLVLRPLQPGAREWTLRRCPEPDPAPAVSR